MNQPRAIFLDRDGIINRPIIRDGKPYPPASLNDFKILPGVKEACALFKEAGYLLVVATNQPDVGRGTVTQASVEAIHALLMQSLPIDRIEVCYHPGKGLSDCECRKPRPGMLLRAASELNIDLKQSWMIGDRWGDIACGHAAGCKAILIGDGYGEAPSTASDHRAESLEGAVTIILK